uniref:DUF3456 domain-containing protein n=1 Tax=Panagrolaimus sp. PS1159 TaxID=55785 RepID=A0AC35G4A5_9BILA
MAKADTEKYSQIDANNIQMPTKCEGCLILSREIETVFSKLNTKIGKEDAEIWLIEQLETVCEEMLHFKIHKEKSGIDKFSPDSSKTMKTLKNLRMPEDLWEAPSVETEMLQKYCETIIEKYESEIETWFWKRFKHQTKDTLAVSFAFFLFLK